MLAIIRIFLLGLAMVVAAVPCILYAIIRPFHPNLVYRFGHPFAWMTYLLGVKIEIRVPDSIKDLESAVYIGNHQNSYDIFLLAKAIRPRTVTIGKKSLKWIPVFGQLYWISGNILIDRSNKKKAAESVILAARYIKNRKMSVWMFPEGTRSYGRGLLPFKPGAFKLAQKAGAPVVPVVTSTTHQQINLNRWNNGKIIMEFLDPIKLEPKSVPTAIAHAHELMNKEIQRLDAELDYAASQPAASGQS